LADEVLAMSDTDQGYARLCDLLLRELAPCQEFLGQFRQITLLDRDPYHPKFMRLFTMLPGVQQTIERWCLPLSSDSRT
jgi:hypothetical protein